MGNYLVVFNCNNCPSILKECRGEFTSGVRSRWQKDDSLQNMTFFSQESMCVRYVEGWEKLLMNYQRINQMR